MQLIHFMKNVAIGGGLLMLVRFGAGPWSVDGWIAVKEAEATGATVRPKRSSSKEKDKAKDTSNE